MHRILHLKCCCCGADCLGRQWWNRDKGYGVCSKCVAEQRTVFKEPEESIRSWYGIEGVHFNVLKVNDGKPARDPAVS